jgi:predicted nucleic acid-binding protein
MKFVFVDTNVFLRFIVGDVAAQIEKAKKIFNDAALSKIRLCSSVVVFFEIYWVLKSTYGLVGTELMDKLQEVLRLTVEFENYDLLVEAVEQMGLCNFDLEDSYNMNYAKSLEVNGFETFDKKLLKKFQNG